MKKSVQIIVSGKVQGVYYRQATLNKATELQIKGIVRNLPSGEVYIEAEGEDADIKEFVLWCHSGPEYAHVATVQMTEQDIKQYKDFGIVR